MRQKLTLKKVILGMFYLSIPVSAICLVILLIVFPDTCLIAAKNSLILCFTALIPTLFPFFVLANIILYTGFPKLVGHFTEWIMRPVFNLPGNATLPLLLGLTAGYPTGAKVTVSLYENEMISKSEAERLLGFTNNSGPLFIVGAVSVGMLGHPEVGVTLLLIHMISALITGIISGIFSRNKTKSNALIVKRQSALSIARDVSIIIKKNPGSLFGEALLNALQTTLLVCGFVVFFSVLTSLVRIIVIDPYSNCPIISSVVTGLIEITNGNAIAAESVLNLRNKLVLISFLTGVGGLSVYMQVAAICSESKLGLSKYIKGKLLQGLIAAVLAWIIF